MQKHQYNSMEPRKEEFHSAPQPVLQDHLDGMHANTRPPPSFNVSENKPVHNFSIQTGEEFALEFMRDRVNVNLKKPSFPNVVGDPNYSTGYMEFKGILGHKGSESGSDIEKGPKEFDRRNSALHQERSNYGSARSIPRTSSNQDSNRVLHGISSSGSSNSLSTRMKILCSFGGRILPRPSDGKLRYVGGETRIISIRKDITWPELMHKISSIYNDTRVIKYQLPGEDLDALVSVTSDEDLRNMMEECHDLQRRRGSLKLRMFLFSIYDLDDTQFGLGSMDGGDSEVQYVVAINGMNVESRSNSILRCAGSSNDIQELDRQTIDKETKRAMVESYGVGSSSLTGNVNPVLTIPSSQPMLPTSSNAYEAYPFFYEDPIVQQGGTSQYPIHNAPFPSNSSARNLVDNPVSLPTFGVASQGIASEGQASSELQVQSSLPSRPFEGSLQGNLSEASVPVPAAVSETLHPALPLDNKISAAESEVLNPTQISRSGEDDFYPASTDAFSRALVDAESNIIDFSCLEPPPLPNRVYYSERIIPREHADLLNRSAKSDDAYGSHLLMADLLSDLNRMNSVNESSDMFHNENLSNLNTVSNSSSAKPLRTDGHAISSKHLPDAATQVNPKLYQLADSDLKPVLSDNKVSENETNTSKDSHKILPVDETKGTESLAFRRVPSVEHNENLASKIQDQNLSEAPTREPLDAKSKPSQGDILIDIEDRFPRDFLYDMFSKAIHSEDSANISPLPADRAGLSLKMDNHEPKSWSYFQKLAHEGFDNVSLIDQDNLGYSSAVSKVKEGDSKFNISAPPPADVIVLTGPKESHSNINFGEENQKILPVSSTKPEAIVFQPENNHSELKANENKNINAAPVENVRPQESEYQVCF